MIRYIIQLNHRTQSIVATSIPKPHGVLDTSPSDLVTQSHESGSQK